MTESTVESMTEVAGVVEEALIRVLHVDDEAGFLKAAKQILEMQDAFDVVTASSVEEAKEIMKGKSFDVIVSDYQMPDEDGLQFLKELREDGNDIPFIMFTGKGREEVAIKALNLGADRYFNKIGRPESVYDELAHSIRRIVKARQAEEELRKSEIKYRSIVENAGAGIATTDLKGRFVLVNQALCEMFGYSEKELIGKPFIDFLHPDDKKRISQVFLEPWKNPNRKIHIEFRVLHKNGHIVHMYSSPTVTIYKDEIIGFNVIISDITEQKKTEDIIGDSEERFGNFYESIPDALAVYVGREGRLIEYNNAFKKRYGYCDEELTDKMFLDFVHPDHHAMLIKEYRKEHSEEELPFRGEINGITKKGESFPMEISAGPYKKKGRIIGINVMHRDITKRKEAEKSLKETLDKLQILNEKLSVVGKLTRHDVRNKLAASKMNIYLAKKKLGNKNEALKYLQEIDLAIELTERIFEFASTYEKLGVEELVYMDSERTLQEALQLFSNLHGVRVVNDCHGLMVLADSLLRQLFYNLIDNSLEHGKKVSQIRIYYEEGEGQLKLVYEDDGVGIPKAEKEKIFRKGYGKGSGYGLYLIKKMCEVYGWTIQETGKHGKGARFTITIPKRLVSLRKQK